MTSVRVGERTLALSNLHKVLYPDAGFTKGDVIHYYASAAPALVPHLAGRCITLKRFPEGVHTEGFFEKRCPSHRPRWLPVAPGPGDRAGGVDYCLLEEPAALVWTANLAAIELHAPMARAADLDTPTMVVFDLDPGPPAGVQACSQVALLVRQVLDAVGLQAWPKTSGSKGLQLYVPLNSPASHDGAAAFANAVGALLEQQHPRLVTTTMAKAERPGKVFVDWSQNNRHKTTVAVYSLRARPQPTVSTPVTWEEVEACAAGRADLRFEAHDVLARLDTLGDLFAPTLTATQPLPT